MNGWLQTVCIEHLSLSLSLSLSLTSFFFCPHFSTGVFHSSQCSGRSYLSIVYSSHLFSNDSWLPVSSNHSNLSLYLCLSSLCLSVSVCLSVSLSINQSTCIYLSFFLSSRTFEIESDKKKKAKMHAKQYIDTVMTNIQKQLENEHIFPTKFGESYSRLVKQFYLSICFIPSLYLSIPSFYLSIPSFYLSIPEFYLSIPSLYLSISSFYLSIPSLYLSIPSYSIYPFHHSIYLFHHSIYSIILSIHSRILSIYSITLSVHSIIFYLSIPSFYLSIPSFYLSIPLFYLSSPSIHNSYNYVFIH